MICDENTFKRKNTKWKKCRSVTGRKVSKPMTRSKSRQNLFPYKRPLSTDSLLAKVKDGYLFGYVQCNLVVPNELKSKFANFPPIFKNTKVGRNDIGDYMKNYAIENEMLKHPQRTYCFVQYSPPKCFNNFLQSVVDARREGDENPLSGVVAETMKLLGNSSYGYQIFVRSRHTITKYLNDQKTLKAIKEPLFKRLNTVEKDLYEVELLKSTIEHREPIIVGFFILQYAKLRMLELFYNFFDKFCDVNKFEELETHTDSLYLALAEKNLYDCIKPDKRAAWGKMRENNCRDSFNTDAKSSLFPRTCCSMHKKYGMREPGLFKEELRCTEMLCLCSKTYCGYDNKSDKFKFSSKGLNKRILKDSGDRPMSKYRRVLDEAINLTSTNRGFRTSNHMVATYEQTKKELSYFYPKRQVQDEGIHTKPLYSYELI